MRHIAISKGECETTRRAATTQRYLLLFALLVLAVAGCTLPEQADRQRREAYLQAHPEMDAHHQDLLRNGGVWTGMTKAELIASLGEPDERHETVITGGRHEQWIYRYSFSPPVSTYIYLEDDKVVGWSL